MNIHNDIDAYISLKPRNYRFLKAINISRSISRDRCFRYDLELILSKCSADNDDDLRLLCIGAFDINLGNIDGMLGLLVDIEDISDRQLEGGRYQITEQEEGAFFFIAMNFLLNCLKTRKAQ
jgi:hypothetical protein